MSWKDNCYYISRRSNQLKYWEQAKLVCKHMQSDLLSIESQDELVGSDGTNYH